MGMGAIYKNNWIQARWPKVYTTKIGKTTMNIDLLELFAIYVACVTWGHHWAGKRIIFITDNAPITDIWHAGTTRSKHIMFLVRKIFLIAAKSQYTISLKYIRGTNNVIADSLSRFQMQKFWKVAPTNVNELPTEIPDIVWETLQATT